MQARIANAKAEEALRLSKEQEDIVRRARALEAEAEEHWKKAKQYGNRAGESSCWASSFRFAVWNLLSACWPTDTNNVLWTAAPITVCLLAY